MGTELIERDFKVARTILSDSLFKKKFDKNKIEDIKLFKLLQAREENIDFEMELAEMICGDNLNFPYRSSFFMTKFFQDLGLNYTHDGGTRRFWMKDVLEELDIKKISYVIENGLFRKKDYKNPSFRNDKTRELNEDDFLSNAVVVFRKFIEDSICINDTIDLAAVLDLNLNVELLFDRTAKTKDVKN